MKSDNEPKEFFEGHWLLMLAIFMAVGLAAIYGNDWLDTQKPYQCTKWRN